MLISVHIPRFSLAVALSQRGDGSPAGGPAALAPADGAGPIGDANAIATAAGVRPGMRTSEAYALCPALALIPPDPLAVRRHADRLCAALETIGAEVEPIADGQALFDARPLDRLLGGLVGVLREAALVTDQAISIPPRLGAAPGRFAACQAAKRARVGKPLVLDDREALAFIGTLSVRELEMLDTSLQETLMGLGITRLSELAALSPTVVRDRFGPPGERAWLVARGEDSRSVAARAIAPALREMLALPEPLATEQALAHVLRLLLDRLLARPERGQRAPRGLRIGARLAGGGSFEQHVPLREPTADRRTLELLLLPRLLALEGPIDQLAIELCALTEADRQTTIWRAEGDERRARVALAARHVRAAVGRNATLRVVAVDPESRLPERRFALQADSDGARDAGLGEP